MRNQRRAFTLVELLVVVAIIAMLIALLFPAVGSVRAGMRATASMSNLRQWGVGITSFSADRKGLLPWEGGKDAGDMPLNLVDRQRWWGNVVPPLVDQPAYADLIAPDGSVPTPATGKNIFIDPAAATPANPSGGTFSGWTIPGTRQRFYFNYVPNSQLNNTLESQMDSLPPSDPRSLTAKIDPVTRKISTDWVDARRMRMSMCRQTALTAVMIEMRSVPEELDGAGSVDGKTPKYWHPYYGESLNRHRGDWQRFSARHRNGGHLLMADGHVEWRSNNEACTPSGGTGPSKEKGRDFNKTDLLWDPLGPALMD